jgi:hypothetical protein
MVDRVLRFILRGFGSATVSLQRERTALVSFACDNRCRVVLLMHVFVQAV